MKIKISIIFLLTLFFIFSQVFSIEYVVSKIYVFEIKNAITKPTLNEFKKLLNKVELENNSAILLILDTPGGELESSLEFVKTIESSKIPIIGFVYPSGAHAWSAGVLILLSTHVAVMAPGTVIGSCQPVVINLVTGTTKPINESKVLNAIEKYFEEVARFRNRNVTFAKYCVLKNLNLGAREALKYNVIDLIANNPLDLVEKLNNTEIRGIAYIFKNVQFVKHGKSIETVILEYLNRPDIGFTLFTLGFLLLIISSLLANPYIAIIGLVFLILPFLIGILPINIIPIVLLLIGIGLILGDVLSGFSSHGILLSIGLVLSILGGLMIQPYIEPSKWSIHINPIYSTIILYFGISICLTVAILVIKGVIRIFKVKPLSSKLLNLRGYTGIAVENIKKDQIGYVKICGEYWRAKAIEDVYENDEVIVIDQKDDLLIIKRKTT